MTISRFTAGALDQDWEAGWLVPACVLTTELEVRQKREQIPARTLLLAVEDPETRVGSGGATLNALLVAAEHLSARAGFTVSVPRNCYPWAHVLVRTRIGVSKVTSSSGSIPGQFSVWYQYL